MVRNSTPQNLITKSATVLDDCSSISGYTIGGSSVTLSIDNTLATSCIKATTLLGYAGFNRFYKRASLDLSQSDYIEFHFWADSLFSSLSLYLFTDTSYSKYFIKGINVADVTLNAWNRIRIYKSEFTPNSAPNFNNIITQIQFAIAPTSGNNCTVYFDNITCGQKSLPKTCFTFDDGYSTVYDVAYPYMQAKGIKGTVYVISSAVGGANYMTLAQLKELYNAGWTIANHTANHVYLATLTKEQQRTEIQTCMQWLIDNGFGEGSKHIAFPYGSFNDDTLAVCAELGIKTARTTTNGINIPAFPNLLKLNNVAYDTTISVANLKSLYVDKSIYQGGTIMPMLHAIESSTTQTYNITIANFQTMIDYHVLRKTDNLTVRELYEQLTNPRKQVNRL